MSGVKYMRLLPLLLTPENAKKMSRIGMLIISALLALCSQQTYAQKTDLSAQVDGLFTDWNGGNTPGAGLLVIRDGKVLIKKAYGLANIETKTPITPDTCFLLGSVTKQFTAMAVMLLAERGQLRYDDPLAKFFPQFPPYAQKITVRNLLNHTSGLPDYEALFVEQGLIEKDWPRSVKTTRSRFEPTAKDALNLLARQPNLLFEPGTKFEYSNSGYVVLAQIIEKASGQSYAQFLKQNIFKPLGMKRSYVYDESRPNIPGRAASYTMKDGTYREIDYTPLNAIYGEDNVFTTLNDLVKWEQALSSTKLIKAETLQQAFSSGVLTDGSRTGYGYGWFIGETLGLKYVGHSGGWLGFANIIRRYPDYRFTVVLLTNYEKFRLGDTVYRTAKLYLGEHMSMPMVAHPSPEALQKYVGKYELEPGNVWEVVLEDGALWLKNFRPVKVRVLPASETKFFIDGREDLSLVFEKSPTGVVSSLKLSGFGPARRLL
jgi:CubicO group peptidase (beta-lactamase class C family)